VKTIPPLGLKTYSTIRPQDLFLIFSKANNRAYWGKGLFVIIKGDNPPVKLKDSGKHGEMVLFLRGSPKETSTRRMEFIE
jgi:hypothetical protein